MDSADVLAATIPMKPPRLDCPGIEMKREDEKLIFSRRWLRWKHFFFLAAVVVGWTFLAAEWNEGGGPTGWLVVGSVFGVSWTAMVLSMFVNTTRVEVTRAEIRVTHGPLPSLFGIPRRVHSREVERLFAAPHGTRHAVRVRLRSGEESVLVAPLISLEQARFIVAHTADFVGLGAERLETALEQGDPSSGTGKGAPFLVAVVPLFVVAVLSLFYFMARSELSGSLTVRGELGSFAFTPDACSSGEPDGFGGVSLTSASSPHRVRVVNDPIRGQLVVVVSPGRKNQVLDGTTCSRFEQDVHRTSTNINDVWVREGSLRLECPELSGSVQFAGCH